MIEVTRRKVGPLRVAAVPVEGLRSVTSLLAFEAGQWSEPRGRPGVARMVAQSLMRGTTSLAAEAWAAALDDLGAIARLDVGAHAATLSGQCLSGDLAAYLRLVADAVLRPAFDAAEVESMREQTIAALEEESRDTRAVADRTWRELAYPKDHPFRSRPLGSPDVVRDASPAELAEHHRRAIVAGGAALVLVGGLPAEAMLGAAEEAFSGWPVAAALPGGGAMPAAIDGERRRSEVLPDKTQCDVVLGWPGLARTDPRFVAARVTNMVFAADTFASRAGRIVRDELGLAYYYFSTVSATRGQGPWVIRMGVNPRNVDRAVETTFRELRALLSGDLKAEDLELAQDKLVGELQVDQESPAGIAAMVLESELFDLGEEHLARYPEQLRAVTRDEVVETARAFLPPERYALAIAGPALAQA